jgi:hypothetical protein
MSAHPSFTSIFCQSEELMEAVVLPMKYKDRFTNLGIKAPKGKKWRTLLLPSDIPVRCAALRPSWDWQNTVGSCLCCADRGMLLEACSIAARADVYW